MTRAGIALTGVGGSTIDATEAAQALVGQPLTAETHRAGRRARGRRPPSRGPTTAAAPTYKRHIVRTFVVAPPEPRRARHDDSGEGGLIMTSLFDEIREPAGRRTSRCAGSRSRVNGEQRVAEVEPRLLLAHLLRQGLGLTGTHTGCDTTNCGACTVLVDGTPVKSCTMLAVQADGHEVTTVEGLATRQRAAPDPGGLQGRARPAVRLLHARA